MDYTQAFAISAAGMATERTRVDVAALNLANANTIQTPDGVRYQPARVIARATPLASFGERLEQLGLDGLARVAVPEASVEPTGAAPRAVYEPGNPYADGRGFVTYPGVDAATEMVTLMTALRSYEANVAALNMVRTLALKALDIGGAA